MNERTSKLRRQLVRGALVFETLAPPGGCATRFGFSPQDRRSRRTTSDPGLDATQPRPVRPGDGPGLFVPCSSQGEHSLDYGPEIRLKVQVEV